MVPLAGRGDAPIARTFISISGIVQGVGFRPFVFRLATEMGLNGWVSNSTGGVRIEAGGTEERLAHFIRRLRSEAPPLAIISALDHHALPDEETGETGFFIRQSSDNGERTALAAPDAALCLDCLRELFDPDDRRYRYPFITCTNCGPRYSIITDIPYDRPNTTMTGFPLCPDCLREYRDPLERRFHAQPLACPACGPNVWLADCSGSIISENNLAVAAAADLLKAGSILAIKGLGGYHLAVDACSRDAVSRLRERKKRDEKPFAVMVPDLAAARSFAHLDVLEERLLSSPECPIVIVRRREGCPVSGLVAPGNAFLGLMLPYTPLHHLLLRGAGCRALVMTSANLSDEPIVFQDADARQRLSTVADYFLMHDRPIHISSDDSVIRVFQGRPLLYRRARGYVPRPILLPFESSPVLATGAELKNTICLVKGNQAFLSQHIGDLQSDRVYDSFRHIVQHMSRLLEISPGIIACDQHPDYLSSVYAGESGLTVLTVQHHHAHLAACMAENGLEGETIGLIFDGTGYGTDGTVWGGEFLVGGYSGFRRVGHFRQIRMPGGDAAVREPWRMALAFLYQALGTAAFAMDHPVTRHLPETEQSLFITMLERGLNSPFTSSCGRLFDAVAALLDVRQTVTYDGQAAIELEALAETSGDNQLLPYEIGLDSMNLLQVDFSSLFPAILNDCRAGVSTATIARRFHATVAQASVDACARIARETSIRRIVLSGGVFQNRLLSEMVYTGLIKEGLQVSTHRLAPPNDGCIALGQAAIAGWQTRRTI
jgi:hydrogenase maturation protein HypF